MALRDKNGLPAWQERMQCVYRARPDLASGISEMVPSLFSGQQKRPRHRYGNTTSKSYIRD
jgi:hypothetical protein